MFSMGRSITKALNKQKAAKAAKAKAAAAAKAKAAAAETAKRKETLANADTNTVSGRIQKQAGMEGFDDARTQDIVKGAQFGEAVLGDGLGRLGESDTLNAMQAQAAELAKGFSSEEMLARQEKGIEGIQGSTMAQSRAAQAALARSGVKGAAAGTQLANIAMSGVEARGNLERDLMIANREAQMQGLGMQSNIFAQAESRQKFDLSQAAKEKDIALQAGLGFAQMGSTERAAELNRQAQVKAARASRQKSCFVEGTRVEMKDGTFKNIEDLAIGDLTKGGMIYSLNLGVALEVCKYENVLVTENHAVNHNGVWQRVGDVCEDRVEGFFKVYNFSTMDHRIYVEGIEFADFDETDKASSISDKESLEELNGNGNQILEGRRGL